MSPDLLPLYQEAPIGPIVVDAIIDEVAERCAVDVLSLYTRSRIPEIARCRQCAMLALSFVGLRTSVIGRQFERDHSTVVHGMRRAEANAELAAIARAAADLAGDVETALARWCDRLLSWLPVPDRAAVDAYLLCTLLGWTRRPAVRCAYGIWLVASRPHVHRALVEALGRCGLAHHGTRIDLHIRQAGYQKGA